MLLLHVFVASLLMGMVTCQRISFRNRSGGRRPTIDYRMAYNRVYNECTTGHNYACEFDPRQAQFRYMTCVSLEKRCDGTTDCPMGDDEEECDYTCGSHQVRCPEGTCATVCDGKPDCRELADELFCAPICNDGELRCPDGNCARLCDGVPDCTGGEDEDTCTAGAACKDDEVVCGDMKRCAKVCNGISECENGADEQNCLPKCGTSTHVICQKTGTCAVICDGVNECSPSDHAADEIFCPSQINAGE